MSQDSGSDRFEEDVEPCQECGEDIDFTEASAYWKTASEQFWHDECYDQTEKLDRVEEIREELLAQIVGEDCFDGLSDDFHNHLDQIQVELDEAVRRERLRQDQELVTDGGTTVRERTLNPETHTAPDYKRLIYETDAALHVYLKDDKEWWVAHGPENEPPGSLNGPWLFWTTYPSGGWELDFCTKEIASHHLEELYYIDYDGNEAHSIARARLVPMDDAPEFVQEVVGWNSRDVETGSE